MNYFRALAARDKAFARCLLARRQVRLAAVDAGDTYRAYPWPVLVGAAGLGLLLAQLHVGRSVVWAGARFASGPAFGLVKKFLSLF